MPKEVSGQCAGQRPDFSVTRNKGVGQALGPDRQSPHRQGEQSRLHRQETEEASPCVSRFIRYTAAPHGVDIETLRQELGHSDITTTQIYLRSANTRSDGPPIPHQ